MRGSTRESRAAFSASFDGATAIRALMVLDA
jgi:hypothetical protein